MHSFLVIKAEIIVHPLLTEADLRFLSVIKMNLSLKEAAKMLTIAPDSVKKARYRLKKKQAMEAEEDLENFIAQI